MSWRLCVTDTLRSLESLTCSNTPFFLSCADDNDIDEDHYDSDICDAENDDCDDDGDDDDCHDDCVSILYMWLSDDAF